MPTTATLFPEISFPTVVTTKTAPTATDLSALLVGDILAYAPNAGTFASVKKLPTGALEVKIELFDDNGDEFFANKDVFEGAFEAAGALGVL